MPTTSAALFLCAGGLQNTQNDSSDGPTGCTFKPPGLINRRSTLPLSGQTAPCDHAMKACADSGPFSVPIRGVSAGSYWRLCC